MAVRYTTGFETGSTRPNIDLTGTTQSISNVNKISGDYSLRVNPSNGQTGYAILDMTLSGGAANVFPSGTSDTGSIRFNWKPMAIPQYLQRRFWEAVRSSDNAHMIILRIKSDGLMQIIVQNGNQTEGTTKIHAKRKYQINVVWTRSLDQVQVYIDGVLEFNINGGAADLGTENNGYFVFGDRNSGGGEDSAMELIYDDIVIRDDTTYINPGINKLGIPNANGTYTAWTNDYTNVREPQTDDGTGTEIIGVANNDQESMTVSDPTAGQTVNAVMIRAVMIKSSASASTCQILSRVAGVDELSETITLGQTAYANGSVQTFAPATQPTQSQLAAWEIGLKAIDSTADPQCTQLVAEIDYAFDAGFSPIKKENKLRPSIFAPGIAR